MNIIHYCCGSYDGGNYGGVARYDYHIKLIFPNRKFFKGPAQKNNMIKYLKSCENPIVITDNHLSNDIPNEYPCILVHHGCAKTTANRNPLWKGFLKNICTNGQNKMLKYRNKDTTIIISISEACTFDFTKFYKDDYLKFNRIKILHTSELEENIYKKKFNKIPVILGNWSHIKKGKNVLPKLILKNNKFIFKQLNVKIKNNNIKKFNLIKQNIYCKADIFLQLSNSEGNSYATLDALLCGLVVVSTNVGLFFKDIPDNCFVKIPWKKINNINFVKNRIEFAWKNRSKLAINARKWYLEKCSFSQWKNNMINTITDFYDEQYTNKNNKIDNTEKIEEPENIIK